jgi:hypothetical protein
MNAHQHFDDDVLIDALYGLGAVDGPESVAARVRECAACEARWHAMVERRAAMTAPVEIEAEALAAQRANIYRRIEHPSLWERLSGWTGPLVAGAAAACLLAIGLVVHNTPVPVRAPESAAAGVSTAAISDTQLYSDVYAMEQSFEPSAASSIRVLFEREGAASESRGAESNLEQ